MTPETPVERSAREGRRVLFDGVAGRYDTSRQGYPDELVDDVIANAAAGPGAAVLEIGCGTGQLTRQLAGRGFELTAIDIGASMVQAARGNVTDAAVRFQVSSFEDFAGGGPFDLIVSATAFHWVDPSVGLPKAARLLRPGGWLALLTSGERYPEPLQSRLHKLWLRYNRPSQEWTSQPAWLTGLREDGPFGPTIETQHTRALRLSAETVLGVERTRATFLSWPEPDQAAFTADLSALLERAVSIDVVQETFLAMAPTAT
jgi:ubiquinone/menaquinone biosynthesis C-methylase UbiE